MDKKNLTLHQGFDVVKANIIAELERLGRLNLDEIAEEAADRGWRSSRSSTPLDSWLSSLARPYELWIGRQLVHLSGGGDRVELPIPENVAVFMAEWQNNFKAWPELDQTLAHREISRTDTKKGTSP